MIRLALLFIALPMIELALLIEVGRRIGTLPTLGLIVLTGILGAALARWQGLGVLRRAQQEMAAGRMPVEQLADGVMILVAAAVLLAPGILTDVFGFLCLIPATRRLIRQLFWVWFAKGFRDGRVRVTFDARGAAAPWREASPPSDDTERGSERLPVPDDAWNHGGDARELPASGGADHRDHGDIDRRDDAGADQRDKGNR